MTFLSGIGRRWDAPAGRPSASAQPHPSAKRSMRAPPRAPRPGAAEASRAR
jgi:hypothetical protein